MENGVENTNDQIANTSTALRVMGIIIHYRFRFKGVMVWHFYDNSQLWNVQIHTLVWF